MNDRRQGCLAGLLELFLLNQLFDWLQRQYGFGRGVWGCGCGFILLILFICLSCTIFGNTDWFRLF